MEPVESKQTVVYTRKRHRMIDRVAEILEHVARASEGSTLTELAKALNAPVSSTQGLVNGLVATGYIDERDRRYTLGPTPYLLNLIAGRRIISRVGHADLEKLYTESGLTTLLSIAVGPDVFYVDHCSTDPKYAYLAASFIRRSLIGTSGGWVLLADKPQRDLWSYLNSLPSEEAARIEKFLQALPEIRETGICASPHSSEVADGVSIAIREDGRTVATVGVVGTYEEIKQKHDALVKMLLRHRDQWSKT